MRGQTIFFAAPEYQPVLRQVGLDADACFTHSDIRVWRSLPERENATLDATLADGRPIRLHLKRHAPAAGRSPAQQEADAIKLLRQAAIPTVPLIAWGELPDGRSVLVTEDLAGYQAADRLIAAGADMGPLIQPIADLAADLHDAGLHHRDLYLCHFFVRASRRSAAGSRQDGTTPPTADRPPPAVLDLRLIDPARVRRLPPWPFRNRWIVKDLAQLWYSTLSLPVTDAQRLALLHRYSERRNMRNLSSLQRRIERKARAVARHDRRLRHKQPNRNISIPAD